MKTAKTAICILTLLTLSICTQAQGKLVEQFKLKKYNVKVTFFDPIIVLEESPDFQSKPDYEKSVLLDNYLHNNPLYLFEVTDSTTKEVTYLCIHGDPGKTATKMFYKVEVIKGITGSNFNPNTTNYSDKIVNIIDNVNCGGTLFENMELFAKPENKNLIGKGILLYGYYRRVQPYSEIKTSITEIIKQL